MIIEIETEESLELFTELSELRDRIRDAWKICVDSEKKYALKHLGIATKKICDSISEKNSYHEETWDTIQIRSKILLAAL